MDPAYFRRELTFAEASLYIQGLDRRKREPTFAAAYLVNCIGAMFKAKGDATPKWLKEDPLFEDSETSPTHRPSKEVEALIQKQASEANAFFNRDRKRKP